jgi:hypothetical protein
VSLAEKCLAKKITISFLNIWFFFWQNSFILPHKGEMKENVRFIINEDTGLNIIPVDYVAKVIVKTFQRNDILN